MINNKYFQIFKRIFKKNCNLFEINKRTFCILFLFTVIYDNLQLKLSMK